MNEDQYRSIVERMPDVIWTANADGRLTFVTQNVGKVLGIDRDQVYLAGNALAAPVHEDDLPTLQQAWELLVQTDTLFDIEFRWARTDTQWVWLRSRAIASYERDGERRFEGTFSDVTEKRRLEDGLRMAQKMEAIGQLTGGIAHDFNNILGTIIANSHFLLEALGDHDPRREDADQIRIAAERAAALTRQLLAFSRRQVLAPTVVNLNHVVANLEKMLRRLIGEDVDLSIVEGASLGAVRADVSQIEQVIMNLVVNARDAMPNGGKLSIETKNVDLDDQPATDHTPALRGRYVMVAVSDTGTGMTGETKRRLFEPFYTTKERGKGTGLGLSTCYGIVKQSGGYIWVFSELGRGTIFKIYLPRVDDRPEEVAHTRKVAKLDGHETVLVVEDDEHVRNAVSRILRPHGYRVLVAKDSEGAATLAALHPNGIDVVLSDVIIPGQSGPDAVIEVQKRSPSAKALFMSGYTDHAVFRNGTLRAGLNFIQKPFAPEALAMKLREVLDG